MSLIIPANTLASGGFSVDNSLRFNDGSSDYLNRTLSATGNQKKWTWSAWVKISNTASGDRFLWSSNNGHSGGGNFSSIFFGNNTLRFYNYSGGIDNELKTNRLFRDVSAFYHLMVVYDSANGTADNRIKMYVNGVQETSFATRNNPALNYNSYVENNYRMYLGSQNGSESYFDGYLAEPVFVNNQALAPTDFGEFDDSGIWKPIDVSGLTFGTNGFYLEFKESGTGTNASGMGADTSGNTNHFAVNNLTAIDQSTDTCTNNFATWNSLSAWFPTATLPAFSEGNLQLRSGLGANSGAGYGFYTSTIGVSSGKWFCEIKPTDTTAACLIGIVGNQLVQNKTLSNQLYGWSYRHSDGQIYNNNSGSSYGATYAANDIIGIALDLDSGTKTITFYKNGASQGAVTITNPASVPDGVYYIAVSDTDYAEQSTWQANFGSPPYAISSGNTDGNGYGNMEFAVPSGYYVLNSKNLAEYG